MPRTAAPRPSIQSPSNKRGTDSVLNSSPASNRSLRPNRTPKKSQYFEADSSADGGDDADDVSASSGYDERDKASAASSSEEEEEDMEESDASEPPKKKQKRRSGVPTSTVKAANKSMDGEMWRSSIKTGLGPGTQVIIDKPKARSPGKTPYENDRIHPNTMLFLRDLAKNNDREWLKMHDPDYRTSWTDFTSFLECLAPKVSEADETVPELPLKDCIFRIYRDIRFSPDPTPYKPYFSIAWSRTGRKGPYAAYYFQIKPGGASFLGGGLWMPDAQALSKLRRNIDKRPQQIKQVLTNPRIRTSFLGGVANNDKKAIAAFTKQNAESALKTKPRDYDASHENIELLRLKNFTIGRKLDDEEVVGAGALDRIGGLIRDLVPFVTFLNSVVMPDSDSDEDEDEDEDESSEGGERAQTNE